MLNRVIYSSLKLECSQRTFWGFDRTRKPSLHGLPAVASSSLYQRHCGRAAHVGPQHLLVRALPGTLSFLVSSCESAIGLCMHVRGVLRTSSPSHSCVGLLYAGAPLEKVGGLFHAGELENSREHRGVTCHDDQVRDKVSE